MPARRQEGVLAIPTAKERDFRQGCITPPVRGSIWLRCGSLWRCSPAFAAAFPVASSVCTSFNPDRPVAFLPVCPRAGRQAQGQAGMQAEGQGCQPDGRKACRPFRPQRKGTFAELMSLCPCVAAFGANVVACGVPQPLSDPDLPPTFAPKRQGNAPGAYRRPRLRPSFGQPEGIGRPIPSQVGNDRFTPNRRTKQEQSQARLNYVLQGGGRVTLNPSATDLRKSNTQSVCYGFLCPLRHSSSSKVSFELLKGFRVTPETTLPLAGRGFLSEVGKPVFPTCGAVAGSCA